MSDSLITMRKRYQTLFHGDSKFLFGLTWRGDFARILRFFIIALWLTESKLRISVTSESNLQAVDSKPAPVSSNLHARRRQLRHIHIHGIQASNFGHINHPRQSVASTSKKSKLRISATSILHPRPIGGVRCARQAITFVLYTFVANDGRE